MAATVILNIWNANQFQSIKIDNVDLDNKVELLKSEASNKLGTQQTTIDLLYCGRVLEDDQSLSEYGVKNGATIHVLKRPEVPFVATAAAGSKAPKKRVTEVDIQHLVDAFSTFKASPRYRGVILTLSRPDVLDSVIEANPGLLQDPTALTIIQHSDLIAHMADMGTVRSIVEKHPILVDVVHYVIANIQEEQLSSASATQASTSTGYSYSLDALSDDEDMDSANSDSNRESHPLTRNTSYNAITAAQLAAAISNATNTAFNSTELPSTPTSSSGGGVSGAVITNEMFSSAMQQAFASSSTAYAGSGSPQPVPPLTPTGGRNELDNMEAIIRRLQPQLDQMLEMGLTNVSVNVRALQATSGDVQAAVELVFNGVID